MLLKDAESILTQRLTPLGLAGTPEMNRESLLVPVTERTHEVCVTVPDGVQICPDSGGQASGCLCFHQKMAASATSPVTTVNGKIQCSDANQN